MDHAIPDEFTDVPGHHVLIDARSVVHLDRDPQDLYHVTNDRLQCRVAARFDNNTPDRRLLVLWSGSTRKDSLHGGKVRRRSQIPRLAINEVEVLAANLVAGDTAPRKTPYSVMRGRLLQL